MLKVISGPYRPTLENGFIDALIEFKSDFLTPLLIITPTARLMEHLQTLIVSRGKSLLNIHFQTFSSLGEKICDADAQVLKPLYSDSFFFDFLVKDILKTDKPFIQIDNLALPDGFPPAVRSTLRDLIDAGVSPDVVEAVKEGFLGKDMDVGSLKELLQLYRKYLKRVEELPVTPRIELVKKATDLAPHSIYLNQFKHIFYYGFYDLTGSQADFFQSVVKSHKATFFFPYVHDHPAYAFASRFRDAIVQPIMDDEEAESDIEMRKIPFRILNVSGYQDEAWFLSNEIERLHREEKIPFHEMAVVSRTKDRFQNGLIQVFHERKIPIRSPLKRSLSQWPMMKNAINQLKSCPPEKLEGSWKKFVAHTLKMLGADENWKVLLEDLNALSFFDHIRSPISWPEFLDTLWERWQRCELSDENSTDGGVSILYAEAARGLCFKVVFLIGCEERVFPRIIREDPFLRDDARIALFNTLGYKINPKMAAVEEEKLLFELMIQVAEEKIYFVYQRTDDDGNVVGPSPFLRAFCHERKISLDSMAEIIPRPFHEKEKIFLPFDLDQREVVSRYLGWSRDKDAIKFLDASGENASSLMQGVRAQNILGSFDMPGPFDGMIGPQKIEELFAGGKISPTALELYGMCPFKFFARRILGLESLEESDLENIPADVYGSLVHSFLEIYFKDLTQNGTLAPPYKWSEEKFDAIFKSVISEAPPELMDVHSVLWDSTRDGLKTELSEYIKKDLDECNMNHFKPTFFEKEFVGSLPKPLDSFNWRGKIDRVDLSDTNTRAIDYKTGVVPDGKIIGAVIKGLKAQPPIYIFLLEQFIEKMGAYTFEYRQVRSDGFAKDMPLSDWEGNKKETIKTIQTQLGLMKKGAFPIVPDQYCNFCDVSPICRRHHSISAYRASQGVGQELREMRSKKPARDKS